jgi:hypothetical protein
MVSLTVPGFMPIVIWLVLPMLGGLPLPVFHTPLFGGTPHLNCTTLPVWKLPP